MNKQTVGVSGLELNEGPDSIWAIKAVAGLVVQDQKILLIRETESRPKIGKYEGMLSMPMGHINWNETPQMAVTREVFEEAGLETKIDYPLGFFEILMSDGNRAAVWAFKCSCFNFQLETTKAIWMPIEEFLSLAPELLRPLNREIFQMYSIIERFVDFEQKEDLLSFFQTIIPRVARIP